MLYGCDYMHACYSLLNNACELWDLTCIGLSSVQVTIYLIDHLQKRLNVLLRFQKVKDFSSLLIILTKMFNKAVQDILSHIANITVLWSKVLRDSRENRCDATFH
jgi:hypothetical protein